MKPRFGLIRSKQFIMKDLYTFDMDTDSAKTTYEEVCATYNNIFKKIGVDFVKGRYLFYCCFDFLITAHATWLPIATTDSTSVFLWIIHQVPQNSFKKMCMILHQ